MWLKNSVYIRKLARRLTKNRPLGRLKRCLQKFFYYARGLCGSFLFAIFRFLKLIEPMPAWDKNSIKNILILKPERIGDAILATPTFQAIRQHFPDAYIGLVVSYNVRDAMNGNPFVNEIFTFKAKGISAIIKEISTIKRLKALQFDLAVILYPTFWCNIVALFSGARHRVGYDFHNNGFFLTVKIPYMCESIVKHEVEVNLDVVRAIGVDIEKKELFVNISEEAERYIIEFLDKRGLKDEGFVVIHPGAFEEYIRWNEREFAKVADRIIEEQNMKVILLAGPGEQGLANRVARLMKKRPIVASNLKLSQTVSLIKRAILFIGNSTGPMHIAAALKIPVVAIFGNIHPLDSYQKWGPYGEKNIVVHKDVGCTRCQPSECNHYRCMGEITADDVYSASVAMLRKYHNI